MAEKKKAGRPKGLPKTGGRKPGVHNVLTRDVKEAIVEAADRLGGVHRLTMWAQESDANERIFWSQMYTKILPKEIKAEVAGEIKQIFDSETLKKMAEEFIKKGS